MANNILEYLERAAGQFAGREAYEDANHMVTFAQTKDLSGRLGTGLAKMIGKTKVPVAVFMDKNVESIISFLGIVSSGNFYCPLDSKMPKERILNIMQTLEPAVLITDMGHREETAVFAGKIPIVLYEELIQIQADEQCLTSIYKASTEQDPLYVLFTSGSTGVPKGVLLNHRVVINYLEWLDQTFEISETDVFGNQAPFYFDISVHDIYGALYFGAKMVIIPKSKFSFPVKLIDYMNEKRVSTFLWVPSAMGIVANLDTFKFACPQYLRHVMFAGEVLPRKQLDYWRKYLPYVEYANLYGPTETFVCTAYIMDGSESEGEPLSIGQPIFNSKALILTEENQEAMLGEVGELCLRGSCLAIGYYNNEKRTEQSFVQNPLHNNYKDTIYRTGDLVRMNDVGNLIYISRKDYQIKHMGYRIELGEIEAAVGKLSGVHDCACIYDNEKKQIILFFDGVELEQEDLIAELEHYLPVYMLPTRIKYMERIPHNVNGKIDRKQLRDM